jgi:hypothetical protein
LQTARPVAHQQHHADQVEDPHEHARHVQELGHNHRARY